MKTYQDNNMEDMQAQVFSLFTDMLIHIGNFYMDKNIERLVYSLDYLYMLCYMELPKEDDKKISQDLRTVKDALYGVDRVNTPEEVSGLLDTCRGIMMILTKSLRDQGILLKTKVDLDSLVAVKGG